MGKTKNKNVTREQAAKRLERAVSGSRQLGLDAVADGYAAMSVDDYISKKGLTLINPATAEPKSKNSDRRNKAMANESSSVTKSELEQENADQYSTISDVWSPLADVDESSTKQQLLDAIEEACQIIHEFDPEEFQFEDDEQEESEAA
jgi:hypothetical protein